MPVKAGRYLRITIIDRGIGIPPENLPRVFDPYYTTKTTYAEKGMGLGLSLAYSIIKRHHGHITIDSAVMPAPPWYCICPPPNETASFINSLC